MVSAIVSAFVWNYFIIPPLFTFHVNNTEYLLLFIMYIVIAFVNAGLTFKIRQTEKTARYREEKANAIPIKMPAITLHRRLRGEKQYIQPLDSNCYIWNCSPGIYH